MAIVRSLRGHRLARTHDRSPSGRRRILPTCGRDVGRGRDRQLRAGHSGHGNCLPVCGHRVRMRPTGGFADAPASGGLMLPIENRVRELREARDITQRELGAAIATTRQTIAAIEQRRYSPSLEWAFRLARFFEVGIEQLFPVARRARELSAEIRPPRKLPPARARRSRGRGRHRRGGLRPNVLGPRSGGRIPC